jgi:hypothetical protein
VSITTTLISCRERKSLLPSQPLLPDGFRFYLDDALRDWALESAELWQGIADVRVDGVALVGHGVLVGEYLPPPRARS